MYSHEHGAKVRPFYLCHNNFTTLFTKIVNIFDVGQMKPHKAGTKASRLRQFTAKTATATKHKKSSHRYL